MAGSIKTSDTLDQTELKDLEQKAIGNFGELKQHLVFTFTQEIQYGGLTFSLARYATQHQVDLVVVGTHARKGLSHLFYGSVAETLVNNCIRPLVTYHLNQRGSL